MVFIVAVTPDGLAAIKQEYNDREPKIDTAVEPGSTIAGGLPTVKAPAPGTAAAAPEMFRQQSGLAPQSDMQQEPLQMQQREAEVVSLLSSSDDEESPGPAAAPAHQFEPAVGYLADDPGADQVILCFRSRHCTWMSCTSAQWAK